MLCRLFYISKMSPGLGKSDFEAILAKARLNNRALNITGLLVIKGDFFAQTLEGEPEKVLALYDKIKLDDRHGGVIRILFEENVESRIFPKWEMGFRDINESGANLEEIDFSDERYVKYPDELNRVFRRFVEDELHV